MQSRRCSSTKVAHSVNQEKSNSQSYMLFFFSEKCMQNAFRQASAKVAEETEERYDRSRGAKIVIVF